MVPVPLANSLANTFESCQKKQRKTHRKEASAALRGKAWEKAWRRIGGKAAAGRASPGTTAMLPPETQSEGAAENVLLQRPRRRGTQGAEGFGTFGPETCSELKQWARAPAAQAPAWQWQPACPRQKAAETAG
mmetsp:Transcript_7632/g.14224  ORF Transcript_7632/g.14224 Transcript_7632/m.14224 type:complete len:133 (-) Transcript_7632:193-591(-)